MWCWRRSLRVSRTKFNTKDSELNEIGELRGLLKSNEKKRWRPIGHALSH